jgi:hypothetical protein
VILVKGRKVRLITVDDLEMAFPANYGMIHDPEGQYLPREHIYVGPYKVVGGEVELEKSGRQYFGRGYQARGAEVNVPDGPWSAAGEARRIIYERDRGKFANARSFAHDFKRPVMVDRCGKFHRMDLGTGAVVSWRGIVSP